MTPVQNAALRLEMAAGRVNAITNSPGADTEDLEHAVFDRDSQRNALHLAVTEATGMEVSALMRALEI